MSNPSDMEITQGGVKLSYSRFLSDGAVGLLVYAVTFAVAFRSNVIDYVILADFAVPLALLLLVSSSPIGLIVNAISWFLLGTLIEWLVGNVARFSRSIPLRYFTCAVRTLSDESLIINQVDPPITAPHSIFAFAAQADYYHRLLILYHPSIAARVEHVHGLQRMSRSFALIALVGAGAAFAFAPSGPGIQLALVAAGVALVVLTVFTNYHSYMQVYSWIAVLCSDSDDIKSRSPNRIRMIVKRHGNKPGP